jgi:multidrug transporter EmrE-like cation transporter
MNSLALVMLIILITLSEALGQYLLNISHNNTKKNIPYYWFIPTHMLPVVTWLLYGICTYLLLHSYKFTTMGKSEIYWDALSALIVPIIGVIYFSEKINIMGWLGILFIIVGTLMVVYEGDFKFSK